MLSADNDGIDRNGEVGDGNITPTQLCISEVNKSTGNITCEQAAPEGTNKACAMQDKGLASYIVHRA
jgi:hypothetical protein